MEITLGTSCGSCLNSNRPKQPREHAAHYEVAKTERWCFKHDCHVTRESTCDDYEGVNRSGKTAFTRIVKFNERLIKVREVVKLIGDKKIITKDYVFFVKNNWLYYVYGNDLMKVNESNYYMHYPIRSKDSSTDRKLVAIKEILTNTDPI